MCPKRKLYWRGIPYHIQTCGTPDMPAGLPTLSALHSFRTGLNVVSCYSLYRTSSRATRRTEIHFCGFMNVK